MDETSAFIYTAQRDRCIQQLSKQLAFPYIERFLDKRLFSAYAVEDHVFPKVLPWNGIDYSTGRPATSSIATVLYVKGPDGARWTVNVMPSYELLEFIKRDMLMIPNDRLYFEAIDQKNGWSLITVDHNSILGNRWLALISTTTIPRNDIKETR